MTAEGIVDAFLALPDRDDRLEALRRIVQVLSRDERQALQAAVSQRNDIVTLLPFELVLSVFSYLPLLDVWRLRRVSKQWRSRLSTPDFEQQALSRWSSHNPSDRAGATQRRTLDREVRHMEAFRRCRPFSWKKSDEPEHIWEIQMRAQHLGYNIGDGVTVHDLLTGVTNVYRDEAREMVNAFVLTTKVIAFTTMTGGCLFWKPLDDPQLSMRGVQLPSANTFCADGDQNYIVLYPARADNFSEMMIFDASTSTLRSVPVPRSHIDLPEYRFTWSRTILINAERRFVDMFCAVQHHSTEQYSRIHHMRVGFDGDRMAETCVHRRHRIHQGLQAPTLLLQNVGHEGLYMLRTWLNGAPLARCLLFDADGCKFVEDETRHRFVPMESGRCAIWKGSVFWRSEAASNRSEEESAGVAGSGVAFGGEDDDFTRSYVRQSVEAYNTTDSSTEEREYAVNDSFLVSWKRQLGRPTVFEVMCFEEDVHMKGGQRAKTPDP